MLPFVLNGEKILGVTGWHRFFDLRERLAEFLPGMRYQRFERALVAHGDNTTLNSTAQQLTRQAPLPCVVETATGPPAAGLGFDVREQLGERFEFDEAMDGKGDDSAIFQNCRGRSDNRLQ